jgi:hypothetical protein
MNCIWVLRKVKGHNFGKLLINQMIHNEKDATGFATIGLEHHWSPWLRKDQMERLGFKSIDFIDVRHKVKHRERCFRIHLMWLPVSKSPSVPQWDKLKILEGVDSCLAHPLYRPTKFKEERILEFC